MKYAGIRLERLGKTTKNLSKDSPIRTECLQFRVLHNFRCPSFSVEFAGVVPDNDSSDDVGGGGGVGHNGAAC